MYCMMCDRKIESLFPGRDLLCETCRKQWERGNRKIELDGMCVEHLWVYNSAFSSALIQFKESGDEALKDIFLCLDISRLRRKFAGYTLLLMPSTRSKQELRGFSHLKQMYECLNLPMMEPFEKKSESDQKEKSARQRKNMVHEICLKQAVMLPEKIVLCDDVLTTGSTLRGALSAIDVNKHKIKLFSCSIVYK